MHCPISHCLVVTDTPDLYVCSCVSFNVPQIAQDSNPFLNLCFEVSASFHGKAGKLEMRGWRVGWEDQGLEFILGTHSTGSWQCAHLHVVFQPQAHCS